MALTKTHNRMIEASQVNLRDFGAVGDGVTDDTTAIQAWITYLGTTISSQSSPLSASHSVGVLGGLTYRFEPSSAVELPSFCTIDGQGGGFISTDSTKDMFVQKDIAIYTCIKNATFRGGKTQVKMRSDGSNSKQLFIKNCTFINYAEAGVGRVETIPYDIDGLVVEIDGCKFRTNNEDAYHIHSQADACTISGQTWFEGNNFTWIVDQSANLFVRDVLTVSDARNPGTAVFIDKQFGSLFMSNIRHGSENDGLDLVHWKVSGGWTSSDPQRTLSVKNCNMSFTSSNYIARMFALPNHIIISDNLIQGNPLGIYVDSTVPTADEEAFGYRGGLYLEGNTRTIPIVGDTTKARSLVRNRPSATTQVQTTLEADNVLLTNTAVGLFTVGTTSNVTMSTDSNGISGSSQRTGTATADAASFQLNDTNFFSAVASAGEYTVTVVINHTGSTRASASVSHDGQATFVDVYPGISVISARFYHHNRTEDGLSVTISGMDNTDVISVNLVRLLKGWYSLGDYFLKSYGDAAPTSGLWIKGDVVWDTALTAGGTIGYVCTTTGSPGTWKTFGAISA